MKESWTDITDRLGLENTFGRSIVVKRVPGERHPFMRMAVPHGVQVIGFTSDELVVAITETRKDTGEIYCHLVGETVDGDELPEETAIREFLEETGYRIGELHPLGTLHKDSAHLLGATFTFFATNCVKVKEPEAGITVELMGLEEFEQMLYKYVSSNPEKARGGGNSIIALWLYKQWLKSHGKEDS